MAIDNTPPRLKLIVTIAVITVVTLISLDFVFKGYYAMMTDEAQRSKIAPTTDKDEQYKAEGVAFANGAIPIGQAMAQLGKGSRPENITPQPSEDLGPMTGWSKMPKPAPTPQPKAPEPPPIAMGGDAGAGALSTDGGAPPTTGGGDAGAAPPRGGPKGGKDGGAPRPHGRPHGGGDAPPP